MSSVMSRSFRRFALNRSAAFLLIAAVCLASVLSSGWAAQGGITFEGVPVQAGKATTAQVPLSPEEKTYAAIGGNCVNRPLPRVALPWSTSGGSSVSARSEGPSEPQVTRSESGETMDAHETGSGAQKKIAITIRDSAHTAAPIAVQVYFVGKGPKGERFIYGDADLSVNLRGTSQASATVDMPELKYDPNRRAPQGFVLAGIGTKEGWLVLAQTRGRTFATRASSPALLELAQGKSKDSLPAMISEYRSRAATP
jgi:hypothetical protein